MFGWLILVLVSKIEEGREEDSENEEEKEEEDGEEKRCFGRRRKQKIL